MWKAVVAAVVVYLVMDTVVNLLLKPIGLSYLHAFIAMFCGMGVGAFLAGRLGRSFIWIAVGLNLFFSMLSYALVAQMRQQTVLSLIMEQHPMVSVGSFAGAILGAWMGQQLAQRAGSEAVQ